MKAVRTGLIALAFLPVAGRFLAGPHAWGFHHTAYLPLGFTIGIAAAALLALLSGLRRALDRVLFDALAGFLFGRSAVPAVAVAFLMTGVFYLLRTPTHFLGDGVLVGELVGLGSLFRAHDLMDYFLHRVLFLALHDVGDMSESFRLYAALSCAAGFAAVTAALLLLRRSRLPAASRTWIFLLWLLAAPVLIFCGYVESYGFVSVAMLGFLWSGALAQRGEAPPWLPGLFYGLALFFHTTALFAAPALLWLALRPGPASGRAGRGRWARDVLLPAVGIPLIGVAIHVASGYDMTWFRRDFLESKNQRHVLVKPGGSHGFFTLNHGRDLANWILLVAPVTLLLLLTRLRALRERLREPDVAFLTAQAVAFVLPFLLLDRKIGAARDWDLLTPQIAGLPFLAVLLWQQPDGTRRDEKRARAFPADVAAASVATGLLLLVPWLGVNASRDASLARFDDLRPGFARFPKAYATEELAKYYRDNGQIEKSCVLYEESVRINPRNARTRVLLGSAYFMLGRIPLAEAQYDSALAIDPKYWMALDMKGRIALQRGDMRSALEIFRRQTEVNPRSEESWAGYGYAAMALGQYDTAERALTRARALRPDRRLDHDLALAQAHLGKWDAAISNFRSALEDPGAADPATLALFAAVLESRYAERRATGGAASEEDLREALRLVNTARQAAPNESRYAAHALHLEKVLAGRSPARDAMNRGIGP